MTPPKAKKIEKKLIAHQDERIDPYFWMNERENPDVVKYLEEENVYQEEMMKDTEAFQEELYEEMKARYKKDDESLPYFFNQYWYIVRYEEGKEYPIFCRKHKTLENEEEIILDVNILAEGKEFFEVANVAVSPNNELASFSSDDVGRRIYTLQFKDLKTGKILSDKIKNTTGKAVWANDNEHVFYIKKDKSLRAYKVYRHQLGTKTSEDILIFHEKDETFDVNVFKTKSLEYIFLASSSTISDEHYFLPANDVFAGFKVIQPRIDDLEYSVEHYEDEFYIITNADDATNFKLVKTKIENCTQEFWQDVIADLAINDQVISSYQNTNLESGTRYILKTHNVKPTDFVESYKYYVMKEKMNDIVNDAQNILLEKDPKAEKYIQDQLNKNKIPPAIVQ